MNAFLIFPPRRIVTMLLLLGWLGPWGATTVKAWSDPRPLTCCGTRGQCPMHHGAPCPPAADCRCGMSAPPAPLAAPPPLLAQPALIPECAIVERSCATEPVPAAPAAGGPDHSPHPPRRPPRG